MGFSRGWRRIETATARAASTGEVSRASPREDRGELKLFETVKESVLESYSFPDPNDGNSPAHRSSTVVAVWAYENAIRL